jgi:hypothetical protein
MNKFALLKASDIIANSEFCKLKAKQLGGDNWGEIFNEAWLRIREQELKGNTIESPLDYFYLTALNLSKYRHTQSKRQIKTVSLSYEEVNLAEEIGQDHTSEFKAIAYDFIKQTSGDEIDVFYREFCELILISKSLQTARHKSGLDRTTFYRLLKELKARLNEIYNNRL